MEQSLQILEHLKKLPTYQEAKSIGLYISYKNELSTKCFFTDAFENKKQVFVPRCLTETTMTFLEVCDEKDMENFPKNHWGIPEPRLDEGRTCLENSRKLDLLLVPGVGFNRKGQRLGQGGGFYDRYLNTWFRESPSSLPYLLGIGLDCQLIEEEIPQGKYDRTLNHIITPCGSYHIDDHFSK